jgi:hypothetical protein
MDGKLDARAASFCEICCEHSRRIIRLEKSRPQRIDATLELAIAQSYANRDNAKAESMHALEGGDYKGISDNCRGCDYTDSTTSNRFPK